MLEEIPLTVCLSRRPFQVRSALKSTSNAPYGTIYSFIYYRTTIVHTDRGSQQQHKICFRFKAPGRHVLYFSRSVIVSFFL